VNAVEEYREWRKTSEPPLDFDDVMDLTERAINQLEWQRDKAARVAGIDISELDEAWEERGGA
jgi:hypothetical protein